MATRIMNNHGMAVNIIVWIQVYPALVEPYRCYRGTHTHTYPHHWGCSTVQIESHAALSLAWSLQGNRIRAAGGAGRKRRGIEPSALSVSANRPPLYAERGKEIYQKGRDGRGGGQEARG